MHIFKNLLLYLLISLAFVLLYIEVSHFWVDCGGISGHIKNIELPLLLILLLLLYFPSGNVFKNALLSLLPVIGLYVLYDIFYHFLAKSARVSDLQNATLLSDFSPLLSIGLILMVLLIVFSIFYQIYKFRKRSSKRTFYTVIALKALLFAILLFYLGSESFHHYLLKKYKYYTWSQSRTIKKNGRFSSFIYYDIISKRAEKKLAAYKKKKLNVNKILFGNSELQTKRNIYIVILESFIDPRLIKDASFSRSPLADEMRKYLNHDQFSFITASIYGGGTSQSEFEVLTGVKALAKVSSIEFNVLEGNPVSGFTNMLRQNGYHTVATIATRSNFYNSRDAYKSIGFEKSIFLEESDDFQHTKGDKIIFDADLYQYNIRTIKKQNIKTPYLFYTLGMYGHFPYHRNTELRPDVVTTAHKDPRVHRIANQFYYRTKALAHYIDTILAFDPDAIIFVTSDHLPPLLADSVQYDKSPMENIALLLNRGEQVDITGYHYYEIPRLIWKLLQKKQPEIIKIDDETYKSIYYKVLSESLK